MPYLTVIQTLTVPDDLCGANLNPILSVLMRITISDTQNLVLSAVGYPWPSNNFHKHSPSLFTHTQSINRFRVYWKQRLACRTALQISLSSLVPDRDREGRSRQSQTDRQQTDRQSLIQIHPNI